MFGKRKKGKPKLNIFLALLLVFLLAGFGSLLVLNYKNQKTESEQLTRLADSQSSGIEDYDKVVKHAEQLENAGSDEVEQTEEETKEQVTEQSSEETKEQVTPKPEVQQEAKAAGVVCWGDDLVNGDASATYSYMAVLGNLLTQNGYNLPVINKTLQGGGTLSMMKMAGVGDDVLQGYITEHQQAANGAQLNVTETGIRDLTPEQTERNDLDCIPVIFMGYYGGWNHDPSELAGQQENILNTFPNKDRFIVVGTRPIDGSVSSEALDQTMSQKWGEHYISLASVSGESADSYNTQQAMAQAVFQKLQDLGYISKS